MTDPRRVLDLLPKPVAVIDAGLTLGDANRAFATRFGLVRPDAATGGRQAFWDGLARTVARMQPAARHGSFRWTSRDPDERLFDVHVTRVGADEFLVVADDVSAYVQVEAIQGSVRHYVERVLNRLDAAILVLDADLRVTLFNTAQDALWRRGGITASLDVIGEPIAAVYPVFSEAQWATIRERVQQGEAVRQLGVPWPPTDGSTVDVAVLPLDAPGEPVTGAICVTTDAGASRSDS